MGYAIAQAAHEAGHEVCLVSGPVALPARAGIDVRRVETAADMLDGVRAALGSADVLIMAAAVADWRPVAPSSVKLSKHEMESVIRLERTTDILQAIRPEAEGKTVIGFAAETHAVNDSARSKLVSKGLDLIVANDVSRADAGFEVETNRVVLFWSDGRSEALPLMSKLDVGRRVVAEAVKLASLSAQRRSGPA
jgi:phosphopantothenoylcysteine decarboxylase/phosphopantothenate--cysteine ligase